MREGVEGLGRGRKRLTLSAGMMMVRGERSKRCMSLVESRMVCLRFDLSGASITNKLRFLVGESEKREEGAER